MLLSKASWRWAYPFYAARQPASVPAQHREMQSSFEQRRQHTLSLLQENAGVCHKPESTRLILVSSLVRPTSIPSDASCRHEDLLRYLACH